MNNIVILLLVLILTVLMVILWKMRLNSIIGNDLENGRRQIAQLQSQLEEAVRPKYFTVEPDHFPGEVKRLYHSPFHDLSFEEAFNVQTLSNELKKTSIENLNKELAESFNLTDSPFIVEAIEVSKGGKMVWKLSKEGQQLFNTTSATVIMEKGGTQLLRPPGSIPGNSLMDKIKSLKSLPESSLTRLTKLSNMIVDLSHFISGTDIVKKLVLMDDKIDYLSNGRKVDKISKLKANYRLARELLASPMGDIEKSEIRRLHKELMELRENWRLEIENGLNRIDDPSSQGFIKKLMTRRKTQDQTVYSQVTEFEEDLIIMDFILIYDLALCNSIQHDFYIHEDIHSLESVRDHLKDRLDYLSGKHPEYNFENYIGFLENLIRKYSSFLPAGIGGAPTLSAGTEKNDD